MACRPWGFSSHRANHHPSKPQHQQSIDRSVHDRPTSHQRYGFLLRDSQPRPPPPALSHWALASPVSVSTTATTGQFVHGTQLRRREEETAEEAISDFDFFIYLCLSSVAGLYISSSDCAIHQHGCSSKRGRGANKVLSPLRRRRRLLLLLAVSFEFNL